MATYLKSERLWFRAPKRSDIPFFTQTLQHPEVRRNLMFGRYPFNEDAETKWFEQSHTEAPPMDGLENVFMTFGLKDTDEPLGNTGLHRISMIHRHAEWGLFIGKPEEWGKGYGREVATTMLEYGFNVLNLNRIHLRVNADNERGIRAYKAAGYVHEGVLREHTFVEGRYVDMALMGVLRDDWRQQKPLP